MIIKKIFIVCLILAGFLVEIFPQITIELVTDESELLANARKSGLRKNARNAQEFHRQLEKMSDFYRARGYLTFSIDSVREDSSIFFVYPFLGKCYKDASVFVPDSLLPLISESPQSSYLRNQLIPMSDYPQFSQKMLSFLENNGYPFAEITLKNADLTRDTTAILSIDRKNRVVYDSIIVRGTAKLHPSFLRPNLIWRKKKSYSEKNVRQIPAKLRELPFVSVVREPGVEFVGDRAYLYLFLDKQRVNQFDGYLGIVPVSGQTGKTMITGELNLSLQNLFTIGERISLHWQAPGSRSQYLRIAAEFPYLFSLPLGVSGSFLLDKKDTTYLNMNYLVGLQYAFGCRNHVKLYVDYTTSSLLSSAALAESAPIDSLLCDYSKMMYGISLNYRKLDDAFQPRRGIVVEADFAAGNRKIRENHQAAENFYDGIASNSVNYRISGVLTGYVPIRKRWGWVAGVRGGMMLGTQQVFNDLFRLGGTQTLQGFDEMSLYASSYIFAQTEFRFWFAKRSYINVFVNGGWYERQLPRSYFYDYPLGFGLGVTFHTKAGDFYLSYALGQQKSSPISFKTGKIHFGLAVRM